MPHAVCYMRLRQVRGQPRAAQVQSTAETLVARPAAGALDFGEYMKQRAVLVNEALERSVPLQYPEVINESMRCACVSIKPQGLLLCRCAPRSLVHNSVRLRLTGNLTLLAVAALHLGGT